MSTVPGGREPGLPAAALLLGLLAVVVAPRVARNVLDRSIQAHGGGGVTDDFPIARMWASARILGIADGPDEVHLRTVARTQLRRYRDTPATVSAGTGRD